MNRHLTRAAVALAVFVLVGAAQARQSSAPAPSGALASAINEIDALVAAEYAKDPVGGVTVGVVAGPALVWTKSYGFADAEARRPVSADTVYRIGSITKQFTALMLLQLAEQGKVNLTDPVEKYLPEINKVPRTYAHAAPITLLQLATMTSGLSREPGRDPTGQLEHHTQGPVSAWEQKVLTWLPLVTYAHEPGTRYLYSNIGYAALGLALSRAAGRPFTAYVEDSILKPLGMTTTAFELTPAMRARVARGYVVRDGKADWTRAAQELDGRGYRVPNGALMTTVGDLAKFVAFELGEGPWILKKETQEDNFSRVYSASGRFTSGYGLGFQATRRGALVAFGHGGSTAGFTSSVQFDRESKTGVIVLRNSDGGRGRLSAGGLALQALEKVAVATAGAGTGVTRRQR
jgi:CubicO group peptidase (beta-lactamase class C family)